MTALDHHKVAVLVECSWVTHSLVRNGVLEPQKTAARILEDMLGIWTHHTREFINWDAGAEVDHIAVEIALVDLGGVNLYDGPVLRIAAVTDANWGRENDMAQNATLRGGPASRNVLVDGFKLFLRLLRLVQPGLGYPAFQIRYWIVPPLKQPLEIWRRVAWPRSRPG